MYQWKDDQVRWSVNTTTAIYHQSTTITAAVTETLNPWIKTVKWSTKEDTKTMVTTIISLIGKIQMITHLSRPHRLMTASHTLSWSNIFFCIHRTLLRRHLKTVDRAVVAASLGSLPHHLSCFEHAQPSQYWTSINYNMLQGTTTHNTKESFQRCKH